MWWIWSSPIWACSQVAAKGHDDGLTLMEMAPGVTLGEVHEKTEAPFSVADHVGVAA